MQYYNTGLFVVSIKVAAEVFGKYNKLPVTRSQDPTFLPSTSSPSKQSCAHSWYNKTTKKFRPQIVRLGPGI